MRTSTVVHTYRLRFFPNTLRSILFPTNKHRTFLTNPLRLERESETTFGNKVSVIIYRFLQNEVKTPQES